MTTDLAPVEARLWALLDRYRPELVDRTIYGVPSLTGPGGERPRLLRRGEARLDRLLVRYAAEHA